MKAKLKNDVQENKGILAEKKFDDVAPRMLSYKGSYKEVVLVDGYKEWFTFAEDENGFHFHKSWLDFEEE